MENVEINNYPKIGGEPFFTTESFIPDQEGISSLKFTSDGLIPAIIQERKTGQVLMMGWMNLVSLEKTIETGRTWFWSRSRQEYWCKGETSGDRQYLRAISYDCDGDTLLLVVDQEGSGACHTGAHSCFFRPLAGLDSPSEG
ncbi:MAG: phosphoribosyl-AMP cyclohydrolase [Acidimicrobiales bacterium]|nr:phosphoribosyl-AMP cyclohydrolase [Acidimicrobiales bacterium]